MDSREIYEYRIRRVIDFISTHPGEELTLERLAEEAGFSRFHFHRLFTAITGETPADFVLRARLELAANFLIKGNHPITRIAADFGFSSPSVFTRVFRQKFHCSPSEYRRQPPSGPYSTSPAALPTLRQDLELVPLPIRQLPDFHVIYCASTSGYELGKIHLAWDRLFRWAALRRLLSESTRALGISFDDPTITQPHRCRYYACYTVPAGIKGDAHIGTLDIPGGDYAIFHTHCRAEEIQPIYQNIYRDWLPASGYQPANSFPFEYYLSDYSTEVIRLYDMEICIPVEPLQ